MWAVSDSGEDTYPNNEKHTGEYRRWHDVQDHQKRAGHSSNQSQAHQEVRDALLNHSGGSYDGATYLSTLSFGSRDDLQIRLIDRQRVCVNRCLMVTQANENVRVDGLSTWYRTKRDTTYLWHEAVGHGQPENTRDKRGAAEEEEVPVESTGLL